MQIGFLVDKIAFGGGERILKMLIDEFLVGIKSGFLLIIFIITIYMCYRVNRLV